MSALGAEPFAERALTCNNEFCEHEHSAPPEKAALLTAIRKAATLALNSVYGTDDRHEYMGLRIADSALNGTPLPWQYRPQKSAVEQYADRCAVMRAEPSTEGLRRALEADRG